MTAHRLTAQCSEQALSEAENPHGTITGMLEMLPWPLYVLAGCVLLLLMAPALAVLSESRARALECHHTARSRSWPGDGSRQRSCVGRLA